MRFVVNVVFMLGGVWRRPPAEPHEKALIGNLSAAIALRVKGRVSSSDRKAE
jgi:hypothetical protein